MKLSEGIQAAYNKKWSMINTFSVTIDVPHAHMTDYVNKQLNFSGDIFGSDLDIHIISLTTPDFTNQPIESFISNKWVIQNGRDELYRFSATFRDHNNMALYKRFYKIYEYTRFNYFDSCKLNIKITKENDWASQPEEGTTFLIMEDTLIESVSNVSFSNDTENQIAEFTVSFKSATPNIK